MDFTISGSKIDFNFKLILKMFEMEANHLLDMADIEVLKLMQQGYTEAQARSQVARMLQNNEGFAKAFWNRQNRLIQEMENKLVALPIQEYGEQHPTEKLKWVLGEVITHHCRDCLRLSKMEPRTLKEWQAMDTGLPRQGKTECSFGCKCMLKPANEDKSKDLRSVANSSIKEIMDATKNEFERCNVIDGQGNVIFRKSGTYSSIKITPEDSKIIRGAELFIHNHPRSSSLSDADVLTAISHDIKEIWVIAPKSIYGDGYYYIKPTIPDGMEKIEFLFRLKGDLMQHKHKVYNELQPLVDNKKLDIDTANKMHYDKIWRIIAPKYGWEYGFKKRI